DEPPPRFSFLPLPEGDHDEVFSLNRGTFHMEQLPCWITRRLPRLTRLSPVTCTALRFIQGESKGRARAIVLPSKIRSLNLAINRLIKYSSNPKVGTRKSSMRMGSAPACLMMCKSSLSTQFLDLNGPN